MHATEYITKGVKTNHNHAKLADSELVTLS